MCAAIVQFYRTYSLYHLVLRVSSDLYAVYLYFFLLRHKYSASLQHQLNWCHPPLPTALCPSRSNGGAPVPVPMVALPFRRVITLVRPTPVSPTPHPFHSSHPFHPDINHSVYSVRLVAGQTASRVLRRCKYFQKQTRRFTRCSAPTSTQYPLQPSHLPP